MPQLLDIPKYYYALALFVLAKQRLAAMQEFERELTELLSDRNGKMGDAIFDPTKTPTREGFNEVLTEMGISVDWKK